MENTIKKVSDIRTNIDSDHVAVIVEIQQKLKKCEEANQETTLKNIKLRGKNGEDSETALREYQGTVKEYLRKTTNMDEAAEALWRAANETLEIPKKGGWKRDTPPQIKQLLEERQSAIDTYQQEEIKRLTNRIKKTAKRLRAKSQRDLLIEEHWDPVKMIKRGFVPRHARIKNEQGRIVNDTEKADTFADFYENRQWKCDREEPAENNMNRHHIRPRQNVNTGAVTKDERREVIRKFKKNKAPGPDGVPIELYPLLDDEALEIWLNHVNHCWQNGTITEK